MSIDYDREALERLTFAGREANDEERPTWRRWRMTEAGEDIGYAYGFTAAHVVHSVTLLRRKDSLPTTRVEAVAEIMLTNLHHGCRVRA